MCAEMVTLKEEDLLRKCVTLFLQNVSSLLLLCQQVLQVKVLLTHVQCVLKQGSVTAWDTHTHRIIFTGLSFVFALLVLYHHD